MSTIFMFHKKKTCLLLPALSLMDMVTQKIFQEKRPWAKGKYSQGLHPCVSIPRLGETFTSGFSCDRPISRYPQALVGVIENCLEFFFVPSRTAKHCHGASLPIFGGRVSLNTSILSDHLCCCFNSHDVASLPETGNARCGHVCNVRSVSERFSFINIGKVYFNDRYL